MIDMQAICQWANKLIENGTFLEIREELKDKSFAEIAVVWDLLASYTKNMELTHKNQGTLMFFENVKTMVADRAIGKTFEFWMIENVDVSNPLMDYETMAFDVFSDKDMAESVAERYRQAGYKNVRTVYVSPEKSESFMYINTKILGYRAVRFNDSRNLFPADEIILNTKPNHEINPKFTALSILYLQEVRRKALGKNDMEDIAKRYFPAAREAIFYVPMVVKDDYGKLIMTREREKMLTGTPFTYVSDNFGEYIPIYSSTFDMNGFKDDESVSGYMRVYLEDLMKYNLPVVIDRETVFDVWSLNDMQNSAKRR